MGGLSSAARSEQTDIAVPMSSAAGFFRLLSHDVRNGLNAIDLQSAYLADLVHDPEVADELKKLRGMIHGISRMLQTTSTYFQPPAPSPIGLSAALFLEDFQGRLWRSFPDEMAKIKWSVDLKDAETEILIDVELVSAALLEIVRNALQFHEPGREIVFRAAFTEHEFVIEVSEGKASVSSPPDAWGTVPFHSTRRGGYGLGLFHARRIILAHRGQLSAEFDAARHRLTTRVLLPRSV